MENFELKAAFLVHNCLHGDQIQITLFQISLFCILVTLCVLHVVSLTWDFTFCINRLNIAEDQPASCPSHSAGVSTHDQNKDESQCGFSEGTDPDRYPPV